MGGLEGAEFLGVVCNEIKRQNNDCGLIHVHFGRTKSSFTYLLGSTRDWFFLRGDIALFGVLVLTAEGNPERQRIIP